MYYIDDPDQLPELPDPGPRDGKHGVDRDSDFDPYPARHFGKDTGGDLTVTIEDARWHLGFLLDRVQAGEEIMLTRGGKPEAVLVAPSHRRGVPRAARPGNAIAARAVAPPQQIASNSPGPVSEKIAGALAATVGAVARKRSEGKTRTAGLRHQHEQQPPVDQDATKPDPTDEPLFFPFTK
jgi:prevent-host-death family protein